jgi:HD-like signal output (HDOD) protein
MIADTMGPATAAVREKINATRSRVLANTPPFRPVALQLMRLVGDSAESLPRIVELLRADAVLTASVMRLVNSPLFGVRYEINNILQAVSFLGMARIRDLIVTIAIRSLTDHGPRALTRACWRHNLATALICQRLSASAGLPQNTCYVAGLVHDIGRLAMLRAFPSYADDMMEAIAKGRDLLTTERELFAADHGQVGQWLLAQWGCPIELQNVAALHENPPAGPTCDGALIFLVRAGSQVADLMGMSAFTPPPLQDLQEIVLSLGEQARQKLLKEYHQVVDNVAMNVNEIELSLM